MFFRFVSSGHETTGVQMPEFSIDLTFLCQWKQEWTFYNYL